MSSESKKPTENIVNILQYADKTKAVGCEESAGIYSTSNSYTDTNSIAPKSISCMKYLQMDRENEEISMDDNKLLEIYMDKIDRDQRELRNDMMERESRITKQIAEAEKRENERMSRIEDLIKDQNTIINNLKDEVQSKLEDDKKYRHTNNIAIVSGVVATVLAMIGIYYATVSMITDIIGVTIK